MEKDLITTEQAANKAKELENAKKLISVTIRRWVGIKTEIKDFNEQQQSGLRLAITVFAGYVSGVLTFKEGLAKDYTDSKEILKQIDVHKDNLKFTYAFGGKLSSHVEDVFGLLRELDSKFGDLHVNELEDEIKSSTNDAKKSITQTTKEFFGIDVESKPEKKSRIAYGDLDAQLEDAKKKLASFEKAKDSAIEFLKNVETFDSDTVFSDEVINAAAYAKLFDRQAYSNFTVSVKLYGDKHREEKAMVNDWKAAVKSKVESLEGEQNFLRATLSRIKGAIETQNFVADNPDLKNIKIPDEYSISMIDGVTKIVDNKGNTVQVCYYPVVIAGKHKNFEEKTVKLILQCWTRDGKRKNLPPFAASILFNGRKIVDLADFDFSVSTENAFLISGYLQAFKDVNDSSIPITYTVPRCGWYKFNDTDVFVDPRRNCDITDDGHSAPLIVDSSSQFATTLTTHGTVETWKTAYDLVKTSPVARFMVAAAVAPPFLKVLGERNFLLYVYTATRAGKTTCLYLGASAVGGEKMIRSFDATKNGLIGAAADVNDYAFLVDEKQQADFRLSEQFSLITYSLANGLGRTKLNKNSNLRKTDEWRTIAIMTGETTFLSDNATGGAFTRLLQLHAPKVILDSETCKKIREIIKENYGHALPLVIDKIFEYGADNLRRIYQTVTDIFSKTPADILPEYQRYIAVITLADTVLNICLGVDYETAFSDALKNAREIFKLTPTATDIDDTQREVDFIFGFIAQNQPRFIDGNVDVEKMQSFYGKIESDCIFITVAAMKQACTGGGFNYEKVVTDLITAGIIIPSDKVAKNRKTPLNTHLKKLVNTPTRCYKLVNPAQFAEFR